MRRFLPFLASAVLLAACQPVADPASVPTATPSPPETGGEIVQGEAPASLVGEYRVAGIDGTEVGGNIGIGLSITEERIYFEPRCAGFDWTYTYDAGTLAAARPADRPVCRIAVHPEQRRLATALDAVSQAARTPSNGIELSGGGHTVTLFSQ